MTFEKILEAISQWMPLVWALVAIVLVWVLIEVVVTLHNIRKNVTDAKQRIANVEIELQPTLMNLRNLTESAKTTMAKTAPLVDRVSLTVDAANLEIMRVDQILEDVSTVTEKTANAATLLETAAKGPLELAGVVASKVLDAAKGKQYGEGAGMGTSVGAAAAMAAETFFSAAQAGMGAVANAAGEAANVAANRAAARRASYDDQAFASSFFDVEEPPSQYVTYTPIEPQEEK